MKENDFRNHPERMEKQNSTAEKGKYRKSPWRYLFAATALISGGWLILYGLFLRFGMLLNTLSLSFSPAPAASIGIIGGADGPTAIFVSGVSSSGPDWDAILAAAVLLISILAFLRLRKCEAK